MRGNKVDKNPNILKKSENLTSKLVCPQFIQKANKELKNWSNPIVFLKNLQNQYNPLSKNTQI